MTEFRSDHAATTVDYDPFAEDSIALAVPTTDAQREVWLACQLGPEASLAYNESISLSIRGRLDAGAMQRALQLLADRHESLRSTLSPDGQSLLVAPAGRLDAEEIDLSKQAPEARAEALAVILRGAVTQVFDLVHGPLVRAQLVRLEAESHELVLTTHHVICDGWSFGVISRDLMAIYRALAAGAAEPGLPPADRFSDYAVTDVELQQAAEADEKYWLSVYDGSVPVLDLPVDRPRGKQRQFASRREDLRIESAVVEGLRKAAAARGISLFAAMFGLYAGLMERLSGESDVVIGVPAAGQPTRGMQGLVGHCVNLLPVRVGIDPKAPAAAMLDHARGRVLDAYEHQACTYGRLLSKLQLARDPSRLPLVSVQFNLDSEIDPKDLSVAGLEVSLQSNPREYENFDLFVNATQAGGAIVLECQYNAALFEAATVRHWLQVLAAAAERYAADPGQPAAALYRATREDEAKYAEFNDTVRDLTDAVRVERWIANVAAQNPDNAAVFAGHQRLSYRELDERANAVAGVLTSRGVGPGSLVGLCCTRGPQLLVGLLGVLKTGAGYVPLDPAFPKDRLEYMRTDAGLAFVVCDGETEGSEACKGLQQVRADTGQRSDIAPAVINNLFGTAYVLYTSGSTGRPKGVVVPQRALVNFLRSMLEAPGLGPDDRLVAVTTISFDIAGLELLLPLTVGGSVVLADADTVKDGRALSRLLETSGATAMQATPSGWRLLLESGWTGSPRFKAMVGGEPLPRDLAGHLTDLCGELWNLYGPTETTIWSTVERVANRPEVISIGRPIGNTTVEIMDEALGLCAVTVPGEICIGGVGLAGGYLNRPDLTTEKFVEDPRGAGRRLYRTGDRGRLRADGGLEHLGRMDNQVKLRGFRIEIEDIEANVQSSTYVQRCVVAVRQQSGADARLIAYCVLDSSAAAVDDVLDRIREHVRERLPPYMVPQHYVSIAAVPLLPNGKVDRKNLPDPASRPSEQRPEIVMPATDLEAVVHEHMRAVLAVQALSMDDDFFLMGGHSLLAARLATRLEQSIGMSVPLAAVLGNPTAATLARHLEEVLSRGTGSGLTRITHSEGSTGPLTLMQERVRLLEEMYPGRVAFNTPSAHRLRGPFDREAFESAFAEMVERQPALRTEIAVEGDRPVQRVRPAMRVMLPYNDLTSLPLEQRETQLMHLMEQVIDQPISLDQAPLFRAALYRLGTEEHVFLFMAHHIVWDGWSFDLLYQEMSELYAARVESRESRLRPLQVTYLDYARWHADWMGNPDCEEQLEFWRSLYAGAGRVSPLATDRERPVESMGRAIVEWVSIDRESTERLRQVAASSGATLNMLLMAVYSAMLSELAGSSKVVLGVPVRGRSEAELERVMGFFINLLPLPVSVPADLPFTDFVRRLRQLLSEALGRQDVPFHRLLDEPAIARLAGPGGLYQSLFSFQDARDRPRHWGPLQHSSVLVMQRGATEDLGLWLMEVPTGLEGGINVNPEVFNTATATLLRQRLLGLLDRVALMPHWSVEQVLRDPGEDRTMWDDWLRAARGRSPSSRMRPGYAGAQPSDQSSTAVAGTGARIAAIWADLLAIDVRDIRPDDNFFDLGGNSLLVMQAVVRMERELGIVGEPRRYVHETLAQLAAVHRPVAPAPKNAESEGSGGLLKRWFGRKGGAG